MTRRKEVVPRQKNEGSLCAGPDCSKPSVCKGLCDGHYQQFRSGRDLTPLQSKTRAKDQAGICSFPGCTRPYDSRGYCSSHAKQARRGEAVTALVSDRAKSICSGPCCARPAKAKGLCDTHYQQHLTGRELKPIRAAVPPDATCAFPGCKKPYGSLGYCAGHATQQRRHKELKPLRSSPSPITHGENGVCRVHLSNSDDACLISHEDCEHIGAGRWYLSTKDYIKGRNTDGRAVFLHREIMRPEFNLQVDHINGNPRDNRRCNLRLVTHGENMQNRKPWASSGYRNVFWIEKKKSYRVEVKLADVKKVGGYFKRAEDAVEVARQLRNDLLPCNNDDRVGHMPGYRRKP